MQGLRHLVLLPVALDLDVIRVLGFRLGLVRVGVAFVLAAGGGLVVSVVYTLPLHDALPI